MLCVNPIWRSDKIPSDPLSRSDLQSSQRAFKVSHVIPAKQSAAVGKACRMYSVGCCQQPDRLQSARCKDDVSSEDTEAVAAISDAFGCLHGAAGAAAQQRCAGRPEQNRMRARPAQILFETLAKIGRWTETFNSHGNRLALESIYDRLNGIGAIGGEGKLSCLTVGQGPGLERNKIIVLNWPTAVGHMGSGFEIAAYERNATASPNCR